MMDDRVSAWLNNLGLGSYSESFQRNAIAWDVLPDLNDGDLDGAGCLTRTSKTTLARDLSIVTER